MIPFLGRYWLHPSGKLSLGQYRSFLISYFLVQIPLFAAVYLSFLVIGFRSQKGVFREEPTARIFILTSVFVILTLWPMIVASLKRMHDLGLRGRDYFLSLNPPRNLRLAIRLIREPGKTPEVPHDEEDTD